MNKKYQVCITAIIICALLSLFKFIIASYSGSLSLKADSFHSLLDMMTSMLVLASIYLESRNFKSIYLQKVSDSIKYIAFGVIIILTSYLSYSVFQEINTTSRSEITGKFWIVLVSITSIVASHFLYKYQREVAKKENSFLILADAFETRMDQITSFLVLLSVVGLIMGLRSENTFVLIILGFIITNITIWAFDFLVMIVKQSRPHYGKVFQSCRFKLKTLFQATFNIICHNKRVIKFSTLLIFTTMIVTYFLSGCYTLKPGQVAIIQYFGKYIDTSGKESGLNYIFPWPIATKTIIDVDEIKRIEVVPHPDRNLRYYITKDENLIDAAIALQYKIIDVKQYYFSTHERNRIIEDTVEAITSKIIGRFDVDDALVHKKQFVLDAIRQTTQEVIDHNGLGIRVLSMQFKENSPPREVISAFNEVSSAREDKRTFVDQAYEYKNEILPEARGKAFEMIQNAEAFKEQIVYNAIGDTQKLEQIYWEYKKSPYSYHVKEFLKLMNGISNEVKIEIIDPHVAKNKKLRLYKQ